MDSPTPKRVEVDFDLCQGHAECAAEASEWFTVGKGAEAKVRSKGGTAPADQLTAVKNAVKYCPTHAISIIEE